MHLIELYIFLISVIVSASAIVSAFWKGRVSVVNVGTVTKKGSKSATDIRVVTKPKIKGHRVKLLSVTDGDSVRIEMNGQKVSVRLANIDAPESNYFGKKQKYGEESKQNLEKLLNPFLGKNVTLIPNSSKDKHGRTGGQIIAGGINASRYQVEKGAAWVYTQFNRDPELPALEQAARKKRAGLWADKNPQAPWDFRKPNKVRKAA